MSEEPIVVGVDGTPESRDAVRWAAREAVSRGRELRVLRAVPPRGGAARTEHDDELVTEGRSLAQATVGEVRAATRVVTADPADALVEAADTAAMLVIGRRERGPLADLVLGSVTREVVARARGTTVVVRAGGAERSGTEIVAGVDGSEHAAHALAAALEVAHLRGAPLAVVYAEAGSIPLRSADLIPAYTPEVEIRAARERLTRWLAPRTERWPSVTVRAHVRAGEPATVLTEAAAQAALLVVGAHGHGAGGGKRIGAIGHGVLHHTTCPVAVVR